MFTHDFITEPHHHTVIHLKWRIFFLLSERRFMQGDTHSIGRVWAISEGEKCQGRGLSVSIGLGYFIG